MSDSAASTQATLSLPKGGGAIRGIGETFQANLFSGTANHSVPIALSAGRGGFGPKLSLDYDSGSGNGIFGLGWQLSLPRITRKTEKGLPHYDDHDVFVLSGSEDLVRCLRRSVDSDTGRVTWAPEDPLASGDHTVFRYRPRTEGSFARIERWVHNVSGDTHWRTIGSDNVTSLFGVTAAARIADPRDARRVCTWLLQETFDAFGNRSVCEYATDDPALYAGEDPGARLPEIFERSRVATQRYIRRILYGNLPDPLVDEMQRPLTYPDGGAIGQLRNGQRYAFEVVFDYGDWSTPTILPHPQAPGEQEVFGAGPARSGPGRPAPLRPDRFSHFRAGFELRTLRRCRRVLMFHHFAELGAPTLVRSSDFEYHTDPDTHVSLLSSVTSTAYDRDANGEYISANIPPLEFTYARFQPHAQRYRSLEALGGEMPTTALDDPNLAIVDLFGDGLPDILHASPGGFRYWRNLGDGTFDRPRMLAQVPAGMSLGQPGVGFGDMTGNGTADLLINAGPLPGFFETTLEGAWQRFTAYETVPGFSPQDANVRMLDLTGDGRADALLTDDRRFYWFECLGARGFARPRAIERVHDLEQFPDVFFGDPAGRVRLADMTGDGLNDIVVVYDGRIEYWPNLGYGRFGRRVTMADAPRLGPDFDPKRLFLADLNGTGCADLVYVEARRVHFWFNRSGNGWSERQTLRGTPETNDTSALQFADIFGTGTTALLWSGDFAGARESGFKALDFCGGVKPYVLTQVDNNLGATTRVSYAPSTRFFLEDRARCEPWLAPLPFPVQVVAKVEIIDHVSHSKKVATYRYHHGHFDGREREFCGFGRVDELDSETFDEFSQPGLHGADAAFVREPAYHLAPVETRTWFHTGIYFDDRGRERSDYRDLTQRFRREYYTGDREALPLPEHIVEGGQTPAAAYRALRGAQLRTEVFAHDGSSEAGHPYLATESRYQVREVQPQSVNHHGVYFCHEIEKLEYHYERRPADPRLSHELTLDTDTYGNPLRVLSISYGRRQADPRLPTLADRDRQTRTLITYTENRYTNAIDDGHVHFEAHQIPELCETRTYELTGFAPLDTAAQRFSHAEWTEDSFARIRGAPTIEYEEQTDPARPQQRLIEHTRVFFRKNDLSELLPLGTLESLALPGETHRLAFTAGLLEQMYGERVDATALEHSGYIRGEDQRTWWIPSEREFYSPLASDTPADELAFAQRQFFLVRRRRDPFGHSAITNTDAYALLVNEARDALGNRTLAEQDYRVLQPFRITDANGNRSEVAFDVLGLVVGSAAMGKAGQSEGDSLSSFAANLTPQQRDSFLDDPTAAAAALLGTAGTRIVYDLERFRRQRQPAFAAMLVRETHPSDPPGNESRIQVRFSYSDGFGREIQEKALAEPASHSLDEPQTGSRWVGSGWTLYNNKGKPIKQFEPLFDDTHAFRFDRRVGVSSTLFYDPLERLIATLHADHTWEKTVFDPWQHAAWDVNDTALIVDPSTDVDVGALFQRLAASDYLPTWHAARSEGQLGAAEMAAAHKTAQHADTPSVIHADALGRTFLTIAHNRLQANDATRDVLQVTRIAYDIEGNQREIVDANGRVVMRYDFDMLGTRIREISMEAAQRRMLHDIGGQEVLAWDSRGKRLRRSYDALRRPEDVYLQEGASAEQLIEHTVFGERAPDPPAANLRGKVYQHYDQAGLVTHEAYDFKGNLLSARRQLAQEYRTALDWSSAPALDPQGFVSRTTYDALNRPIALSSPDGSTLRRRFNVAGLLEAIDVELQGTASTQLIAGIEHDARGQRTSITYGNGVRTLYTYDPLTFRLMRAQTQRGAEPLQDLNYVYDPIGNVATIQDDARQTVFFNNQVVTAHNDYTYDALYRLSRAQGREHIGQQSQPQSSWSDEFRVRLPHPGDGQAMRRYTEQYAYDAVGNMLELLHQADNGNWRRSYSYAEASLIEPQKASNRLSSTRAGESTTEIYRYDAHGNLTTMPHLPSLSWDGQDRLQRVDLAGGGTAFYVYDSSGQRIRKVVERSGGALIEERIMLGAFEVFRRSDASGAIELERQTLNVMDDRRRVVLIETRTRGQETGVPAQAIRYQLDNHLRSAIVELDELGQIISYEEYYPYGGTSYQAGRNLAEVSLKRYRYTGMQRDEETGFSYHGTRYYAAWLGRWITPDTIGVAGGICLYEYSAGNPIRLIDVDGRNPQPPDKRPVTARDLHQLRKAGNAKPVKLQPAAKAPKGRLFDSKLLRATFFALSVITGKRVLPEDSKFPIETVRKHEDKIKGAKKKGAGGNPKPKPPQPSGVADKRLVTARDLHELRNTGNASAVEPVAPEPVKGGGGGSGSGRGAGGGKTSGFPRMPVAGAVAGGAGVASVAGSVIRDLHEGNTTKAVTEAATGTGAAMVLTRVPALAPLAVMVGTIEAYDDNVKRDATAAGSWVEDKTGSHTLGAVSASATATGKSAFEGTFGVVGRNIGEGAAAGYIRATSDEYTMIPWKTQVWADAAKKISSFRYAAWAW